jgi:hypothetical protein
MVHEKITEAYNEYIKWFDNLGINKEFLREVKITSVQKFADKLVDDDELWYMFGEECTIPLTLMERQYLFKKSNPDRLDILSHRYYDDHLVPNRKLLK